MENKFRLLTARDIDCRVGTKSDKGLSLLLYKDARCDMNILDETYGPERWQRKHAVVNGNLFCTVSVKFGDEWVSKEDVGVESKTEAEKGEASDSFKRACVNWGIGRELYTAPFIWVPVSSYKYEEGKVKDRFEVESIGYNERREINQLRIINSRTKSVVYELGKKLDVPEEPKNEKPQESNIVHVDPAAVVQCDNCHQNIVPYKGKGAKELEMFSYVHYRHKLCGKCLVKINDGRLKEEDIGKDGNN